MNTVYILLKVETEKPVSDLLDKAAGRVYTLDGVKDVTASLWPLMEIDDLPAILKEQAA